MIAVFLGVLLQTGGATPAVIERSRLDPKAEVSFHAVVVPETVYVGQPAMYELGVFIADEVRQRLRKNPEFVPPELRSVLAYDLHDTQGARTVIRDGRAYEVHVFRRALFPVSAGRIDVPPARLSYTVPLGSSFFSREETKSLRSEPVSIIAIPPPTAGRPANWTGAVGNLQLRSIVNARSTRVGDPFVVTLRVSGTANVNLLPRPTLTLSWATVVPGAERVSIDTMAAVVRGAKEFDFLVTPSVEGHAEMPPVEYAFFDPGERRYRIARSAATPVTVGAGSLVAVDTTSGGQLRRGALPLRTAWGVELPDAPDNTLWYWVLVAIAPLPALRRMVRDRPRRRTHSSPEQPLYALAQGRSGDLAHVRSALHGALAARLGAKSVQWADARAVRTTLRHHGVTNETIKETVAFLAEIDASLYGGNGTAMNDVSARAVSLYERIDEEAQARPIATTLSRKAGVGVVILMLAVGFAYAQNTLSPRALFERAVETYNAGRPAAAASDFFSAARSVPAIAAAWANAGTASWEAADTARAVVGWQRALRLDPLDDNTRDRLGLVSADAGATQRDVWPIPRRSPAWIAIVLWLAAWGALWRARRPRIAAGTAVLAAMIGAVSFLHHKMLTDSRIVIVTKPAALRALPALGADAGAVPLTGELLTVVERRGVWVHVVGNGNRDGWMDAARVIDLDGRPLRD